MKYSEDLSVIQQIIVEVGWCREPQHPPLNYARDYNVMLQSLRNFCFLQRCGPFRHPHVPIKGIVAEPQKLLLPAALWSVQQTWPSHSFLRLALSCFLVQKGFLFFPFLCTGWRNFVHCSSNHLPWEQEPKHPFLLLRPKPELGRHMPPSVTPARRRPKGR